VTLIFKIVKVPGVKLAKTGPIRPEGSAVI